MAEIETGPFIEFEGVTYFPGDCVYVEPTVGFENEQTAIRREKKEKKEKEKSSGNKLKEEAGEKKKVRRPRKRKQAEDEEDEGDEEDEEEEEMEDINENNNNNKTYKRATNGKSETNHRREGKKENEELPRRRGRPRKARKDYVDDDDDDECVILEPEEVEKLKIKLKEKESISKRETDASNKEEEPKIKENEEGEQKMEAKQEENTEEKIKEDEESQEKIEAKQEGKIEEKIKEDKESEEKIEAKQEGKIGKIGEKGDDERRSDEKPTEEAGREGKIESKQGSEDNKGKASDKKIAEREHHTEDKSDEKPTEEEEEREEKIESKQGNEDNKEKIRDEKIAEREHHTEDKSDKKPTDEEEEREEKIESKQGNEDNKEKIRDEKMEEKGENTDAKSEEKETEEGEGQIEAKQGNEDTKKATSDKKGTDEEGKEEEKSEEEKEREKAAEREREKARKRHKEKVGEPGKRKVWIAQIISICQKRRHKTFRARWFEFPEQTILESECGFHERELFLSKKADTHDVSVLRGKCEVKHVSKIEDMDTWVARENTFFYKMTYTPITFVFQDPTKKEIAGPCHVDSDDVSDSEESKENSKFPLSETGRPILNCMETFAGAGGLNAGLIEAGIRVKWAVERDSHAVKTHRKWHPRTYVFHENAQDLFSRIVVHHEIPFERSWKISDDNMSPVEMERWDQVRWDSDEEFEVERILDQKLSKTGEQKYYVSWVNYGQEQNSWHLASELDCDILIKEFWEREQKRKEEKGGDRKGGDRKGGEKRKGRESLGRVAKTQKREGEGEEGGGGGEREEKAKRRRGRLSGHTREKEEVLDCEFEDSEEEEIPEEEENKYRSNAHKLPKPGDVDMITGGPPCQGFSTANMFHQWVNPLHHEKNKCVLIYLDYIDYFRPKYFIFENVQGILGADGVIPNLLRIFVTLGYQVRPTVLQAAYFGAPQNRYRVVIFGALQGYPLPDYPVPTHDYDGRNCVKSAEYKGLMVLPDDRTNLKPVVTVSDAIGDLPVMERTPEGVYECHSTTYRYPPFCPYQREMRKNAPKKLMDHITMGKHDGTYAEIAKLPRHPDIMANGKLDQPEGTTSQNHKKRLQWDSWFNTIVCTKSVKRDRIVHPHQNRILSVREHARAQGVPDKVKIYGGLHSGYRQMGNMVPVELGKASGLAVMKAVLGRNFTEKERQTWLLEIQGETEEEKRKREIIEKMEERGGGEVFVDLSQVWINQKCPKFTKKENEKQKGRNRTEEEEEEGRKRKTQGGQEEIKETFSTRIKRKKIGQEETKEEKGNEEKENEKENKEEKDTKVDKMVEKDIGEDKIGEQEGNTMDKSERREDEVMDERNKTDDKEEDKKEERDPENKTKEKEERDEKEDQVMEERDGEERSTEVEQKETEEKEMEESRIEGKEREKKDGVIEEESKRGREEQDEIEGKEIEEEPKVDRGRKKEKIGSSDACDIVIEV